MFILFFCLFRGTTLNAFVIKHFTLKDKGCVLFLMRIKLTLRNNSGYCAIKMCWQTDYWGFGSEWEPKNWQQYNPSYKKFEKAKAKLSS